MPARKSSESGREALLKGSQKPRTARRSKGRGLLAGLPWPLKALHIFSCLVATLDILLMFWLFQDLFHGGLRTTDLVALLLIPGLLSVSYLFSWRRPAFAAFAALTVLLAFLGFMVAADLEETLPLPALLGINLPTAFLLLDSLLLHLRKK